MTKNFLPKELLRLAKRAKPQLKMAPTAGNLTDEERDELYQRLHDGKGVELFLSLDSFYQKPGIDNTNFLRFDDAIGPRFAASGVGTPLLRDHDQDSTLARAGTIIESTFVDAGRGEWHVHQLARLTAPWAVRMALDGNLDGVSIGWAGDEVNCSICQTPVFSQCDHWPGDRLRAVTSQDGVTSYEYDSAGDIRVAWVYMDARLIETSLVPVPAVHGAGITTIRSHLSSTHPRGSTVLPLGKKRKRRKKALKESSMAIKNKPLSRGSKVSGRAREMAVDAKLARIRADERQLGTYIKTLGLDLDAGELMNKCGNDVGRAKTHVLDALAKAQPAITSHTVEVGADVQDKRRQLISAALLSKLSGKRHEDREVNRVSSMPLLSMGDEALEQAGASSSDIRRLSERERAKHMLGLPSEVRRLSGIGYHHTSDFPELIQDSLNARLLDLYQAVQQPWKAIADREDQPDFTPQPVIDPGRYPDLLPVEEGGTYQRGSVATEAGYVQLSKAGRILSLTMEMILADRLRAFDKVLGSRADAARRFEDAEFWAKFVNNKMANGKDLIDASNTTTATGALSVALLAEGMGTMATRVRPGDPATLPGEQKAVIASNLQPAFLYVPATVRAIAEAITGGSILANALTQAPSASMQQLQVFADGNMDVNTIGSSYLFARPEASPVIQYGYLAGEGGPVLEQERGFDVDGISFKVRHAFYVDFVDNFGIVKIADQ